MFKVNNKKSRTASVTFLLLTLNIFDTLFSVAIVDFEQVNVSCDAVNFNTLILTGKLSLQKIFGFLVFSGGIKWEHWPYTNSKKSFLGFVWIT